MTVLNDRARIAARLLDDEMRSWLRAGADRQDGRLALFDQFGEPIEKKIVRTAIVSGLAEHWFASPMRPQWTVCRLTQKGRTYLDRLAGARKL